MSVDCTEVERARDTANSDASDYLVRAEMFERMWRDARRQSHAVRHAVLIVVGVLLGAAVLVSIPMILSHLHGPATPLPQ